MNSHHISDITLAGGDFAVTYTAEPDVFAFRRTMGLFATGVTVLMTKTPQGEAVCMTANAVASLSLEPMLLLVCVEKKANMAQHILEASGFSISILSEDQKTLSDYFAGRCDDEPVPHFVLKDWFGGPLLEGCVAGLGCTKTQIVSGGDHWIVIGQVDALYRPDDPPNPLLFYASQYRRLET